jgi:hypothetical protein
MGSAKNKATAAAAAKRHTNDAAAHTRIAADANLITTTPTDDRRKSPTMVNIPKTRKTYCRNSKCNKHTLHRVAQYKAGKASPFGM